jgi:hypothetical protein
MTMKNQKILMALTVSAILFSFTPEWGGEHYEVYVNDKLVLQEFVSRKSTLPTLILDDTQAQLAVYYNHCGQIGKSRRLSVQNEEGQVLKEWSFSNTSGDSGSRMIIKTGEIKKLFSEGHASLKLSYSSAELPKGRTLVTLEVAGNTNTARKEK